MNFASNDTAVIIGVLVMLIFLAAVLWRLIPPSTQSRNSGDRKSTPANQFH